ncbi:hypothetical protein ACS127_17840 [Amphibacillus sp. Q70]|uniref:hypothetical protein n=1 Tax=Amphibacillus sp. Q70 TaxID=3453416 RepID=UPI003F859E10
MIKNKQRKGERSMGLLILGWSLVIIGIVIGLWGFFEFPLTEWLSLNFLSLVVSAVVLLAIGFVILKMPVWLIILAIVIGALLLLFYVWKFQMGFVESLISYIIIVALAIWLVSLVVR